MFVKRMRRVLLAVLVFGLLLINVAVIGTNSARAESPIQQFLTVNPDPAVTYCLPDAHHIGGGATLHYPKPSILKLTSRVNGDITFTDPDFGTNPVSPNPISFPWGLGDNINPPITPATYTMQWEWILYVDGQAVWRNTAGFTCVNGTVTNIYTTNEDLTSQDDILFKDGRLNNKVADADQTVAIYCKQGTIELYAWLYEKGFLAIRLTRDEVGKFPEKPETNMLIKEAHGIRLYRLTTGELQVNSPPLEAGKPDYYFIFKRC